MEPEYINLSVFGVPAYDGSIFNNATARILSNNLVYEDLIPLNKRLYDFSFIGRMDRPDRIEIINNLKIVLIIYLFMTLQRILLAI